MVSLMEFHLNVICYRGEGLQMRFYPKISFMFNQKSKALLCKVVTTVCVCVWVYMYADCFALLYYLFIYFLEMIGSCPQAQLNAMQTKFEDKEAALSIMDCPSESPVRNPIQLLWEKWD